MSFYAYVVNKPVLVVKTNINEVETPKCEEFETIEDIPFDDYEYWDLPYQIPEERVRNRIRDFEAVPLIEPMKS